MTKTAELVRDLTYSEPWKGDVKLYRLSEPLSFADSIVFAAGDFEYVAVSIAFNPLFDAVETVIFGTDENGTDIQGFDFGYLNPNIADHTEALSRAGYTVA